MFVSKDPFLYLFQYLCFSWLGQFRFPCSSYYHFLFSINYLNVHKSNFHLAALKQNDYLFQHYIRSFPSTTVFLFKINIHPLISFSLSTISLDIVGCKAGSLSVKAYGVLTFCPKTNQLGLKPSLFSLVHKRQLLKFHWKPQTKFYCFSTIPLLNGDSLDVALVSVLSFAFISWNTSFENSLPLSLNTDFT